MGKKWTAVTQNGSFAAADRHQKASTVDSQGKVHRCDGTNAFIQIGSLLAELLPNARIFAP